MSAKHADVVIHIDQTLSFDQVEKLKQAFLQRDGTESVEFNPDNPHLVVIRYDPDLISGRDLIDIPRYQGLHGELIGL